MHFRLAAPCVEVGSVAASLEAMRQGRELESTNPLTQFVSIHRPDMNTVDGAAAAEVRIFRHLSQLIWKQLNHHRKLHDLPELAKHEVRVLEDFSVDNAELQAWSTLYYRFVRVDLNWSVEHLARQVGERERTLHRRQQLGIHRLMQRLAWKEMKVRQQERFTLMRAYLPPVRPLLFVGRSETMSWGQDRLLDPSGIANHIVLHGTPGMGKTALAYHLADALISRQVIQQIAWVTAPSPLPSILYEQILSALGLAMSTDPRYILRVHLQRTNSLIVLDNADVLVDEVTQLQSVLATLEAAKLIICTRTIPQLMLPLPTYTLPELDATQIEDFLDQLTELFPQSLSHSVDTQQRLQQVGGNPGAMWAVLDNRQPTDLFAWKHYGSLWNNATDSTRALWLLLALVDPVGLSTALLFTSDDEADLAAGIETLDHYQLLTHERAGYISLVPLARTLAEGILANGMADPAAVSASHVLWELYPASWSKGFLEHILSLLTRLHLAPELHLHMGILLGTQALLLGMPQIWLAYGQQFKAFAPELDRLAITRLMGIAHARLAQWTEAAYALTECIEQAGKTGAFHEQAKAMIALAEILQHRGNLATARSLLEQAKTYLRRYEDEHELKKAIFLLAQLNHSTTREFLAIDVRGLFLETAKAVERGQFEYALELGLQAKAQLQESDPNCPRLVALLGRIYFELNDWSQAIASMLWAIRAFEIRKDVVAGQQTQINLVLMYIHRGKPHSALAQLEALPAWTWE